jgi:hypothetical protein
LRGGAISVNYRRMTRAEEHDSAAIADGLSFELSIGGP